MIQLVIFDLDGVLVDTEEMHNKCLLSAITSKTGVEKVLINSLIGTDGTSTKHKLSIIQTKLELTDRVIQDIDELKQSLVSEMFAKCLTANPIQQQMLSDLSRKYTLAVASNSRKENVEYILTALGIIDYFSSIISNNDVARHKPDPEMFIKTMSRFDTSPTKTLILEDSDAGKYAAIASGAHLLEISNPSDVTLGLIEHAISKIKNECSNSDGRIRI